MKHSTVLIPKTEKNLSFRPPTSILGRIMQQPQTSIHGAALLSSAAIASFLCVCWGGGGESFSPPLQTLYPVLPALLLCTEYFQLEATAMIHYPYLTLCFSHTYSIFYEKLLLRPFSYVKIKNQTSS
jgi:hypothetical protein